MSPAPPVICVASTPNALPAGWNDLPGLPPWLHSRWLAAFAGAGGPATEYVSWSRSGGVVGVALLQTLPIANMTLGPSISPTWMARGLGGNLYQFGQALFSGPGGSHFLPGERARDLLQDAYVQLARQRPPGPWLIKDLPAGAAAPSGAAGLYGWTPVRVLPEMAMAIPPEWASLDDYLAALPGKYRRRARRARRMMAAAEVPLGARLLDADEAVAYADEVGRLYMGLLARAPYVPYRTPPDYLVRLKRARPESVHLRGYFDAGRLVGVSSLLVDGGSAIAHYAAIEPRYNPTHQLYLNLLLDLLALAIERGCRRLNFGRTATTIKSSVGAVPVAQSSYARHPGTLRSRALGLLNDVVLSDGGEEQVQRPLG